MQVVTLKIICKEGDGEKVADKLKFAPEYKLFESLGIYTWDPEIREATKWEEDDALAMTLLDDDTLIGFGETD